MPRLRRAISPRDERGEWVLTPWGLVCRDGTADEHDIRFDEIALMIRDGDNRAVLTGCGCDMTIYPQYFKRGEQLIAALDAAVPTELVRDAPDRHAAGARHNRPRPHTTRSPGTPDP